MVLTECLNLRVLSWSVRETKDSVPPLVLCPQDEQSNTRLLRIASHGEVEPSRSPLAGLQEGERRFVPGLVCLVQAWGDVFRGPRCCCRWQARAGPICAVPSSQIMEWFSAHFSEAKALSIF